MLHGWRKSVLVRTLEVVGNRSLNLLIVEGKSIRGILRLLVESWEELNQLGQGGGRNAGGP